ncbi:tripartite tricarboxylate transporter TctB family protein [Prauserella flavalba]|uniref:DUF1468 domain-containing protein n=1 Tax=Prauserella flavalba TaxID=1477506 RepID=A0A318LAH4_9PSEU|nr:tripartite tricarboxylate transporter TctB family protein [Prauserella flavalba]PXY18719.1 hypothetical protein BA062_34500 [Prauserella flavalba]
MSVPLSPDDVSDPPVRRRLAYRIGPLVLLCLGIVAAVLACTLALGEARRPGPGLWPLLASGLLVAVAALLLFREDPADYERWTRGTARVGVAVLSVVAFIPLFQFTGLLPAGFLLLAFWLRFFARERLFKALILAASGAVVLQLVFVEVLGVPVPAGPRFGLF